MLPEKHRLKKKKDIDLVFKRGRSFKEAFLLLKVIKNDLKVSRFAFVVTLKIAKRAVVRNRIKRKLKGAIKDRLPSIKGGFDVVLMPLKGLSSNNFKETEKLVNRLLKRAKLI